MQIFDRVTSSYSYTQSGVAAGVVRTSRFVRWGDEADRPFLEAGAGQRALGISQEGSRDTPGLAGSDGTIAARAGNPLLVHGPGATDVPVVVGFGGVSANDKLAPDAEGRAVVAAIGDYACAITPAAAAEGELVRVSVVNPVLITA